MQPGTIPALIAGLLERHRETGERQIIGIVGKPGAGKTTFADHVSGLLAAGSSVVVPMDGFHLANAVLDGTALRDRKGAIDTFDAFGFVALLERIRHGDESVVYAPAYRRGLEEPIAASIAVPSDLPFVFVEGNYLLSAATPWNRIVGLLDAAWYVEVPEQLRVERLIARHVSFGMSRESAERWAHGPDQANAVSIETTRSAADVIVEWA